MIYADHKPLGGLFVPTSTPPKVSPRVQHLIFVLSGYDYTVHHRPGLKYTNANAVTPTSNYFTASTGAQSSDKSHQSFWYYHGHNA